MDIVSEHPRTNHRIIQHSFAPRMFSTVSCLLKETLISLLILIIIAFILYHYGCKAALLWMIILIVFLCILCFTIYNSIRASIVCQSSLAFSPPSIVNAISEINVQSPHPSYTSTKTSIKSYDDCPPPYELPPEYEQILDAKKLREVSKSTH